MHILAISRIVGILLMVFSLAMLLSGMVSLFYADGVFYSFLHSFTITFGTGLLLAIIARKSSPELNNRDGFMVVSLFWTVLGLAGSLPLFLSADPGITFTDAVFESISGITTTGSTVLTGLDDMPRGILFYRQLLQWIGGIGVIVIAVAILPILGVGGMQLYRAETPGRVKDDKLAPRISSSAKILFGIYVNLTVLCALAYWLADMSLFDAICHSFATVATGGFSNYDASMGHFQSPAILLICSVFMLLCSISFAVHFMAWRTRRSFLYWRDSETRFFVSVFALAALAMALTLHLQAGYSIEHALVQGFFQSATAISSAGFGAENFSAWPSFLPMLVMFIALMGGCGGSTAGGIKAVRVMLIVKQGVREMKQLIHPYAIIPLKIGNRRVDAKAVSAVWSFFAVFIFSFIAIMLGLIITGLDAFTAFSATVASLTNLGPGLGEVAANFGGVSNTAKWLLGLSMILGRLEIFTLLVIFTPTFWRQ